MLLGRDAEQPALRGAIDQAARPAALHAERVDVVVELVDFLAEVVHRVDALLVVDGAADGPRRIEREKGPLDVELAAMTVTGIREHRP